MKRLSRIILIISLFLIPSLGFAEIGNYSIEEIEEKFSFVNDPTLFTIMAFVNHTGYDYEHNKNEMYSVRQQIRSELEEMNLNLENSNYYSDYPYFITNYSKLLTYIGSPPIFSTVNSSWMPNITDRLNEFYQEANIEYLYEKYNLEYQTVIEEYENGGYPIIQNTINYFNINLDDSKSFFACINLLDSCNLGYVIALASDTINANWLSIGPSGTPYYGLVIHEYFHTVEGPIIEASVESRALEDILLAKYGPPKLSGVNSLYKTWQMIIRESIVRAIAYWAVIDFQYSEEQIASMIDRQTRKGFILTRFIYERIDTFDDYGTVEEWIKALLIEYTNALDSIKPLAPTLTVSTDNTTVSLSWTSIPNAIGYNLVYAPYPYEGAHTINSIDLRNEITLSATLPKGSAFYVTIQAYNEVGESEYSNIELLVIQ